jgi:hypothetical protein
MDRSVRQKRHSPKVSRCTESSGIGYFRSKLNRRDDCRALGCCPGRAASKSARVCKGGHCAGSWHRNYFQRKAARPGQLLTVLRRYIRLTSTCRWSVLITKLPPFWALILMVMATGSRHSSRLVLIQRLIFQAKL